MNYTSEAEAGELICEYGRRVYAKGLVAGNDGNLSCRIGENEILITPTMESKGHLTPDMLVRLDLAGNILSGPRRPSSESKMHVGLYCENPNTGAVIHAHPPIATAFACRGENIPATMLSEAIFTFGEELVVTPFAMPGTEEVPASVKPHAKTRRALLLGNHGALTWAATIKEAFFAMETLEQFCKIYLISEVIIGSPTRIPTEKLKQLMAMWSSMWS